MFLALGESALSREEAVAWRICPGDTHCQPDAPFLAPSQSLPGRRKRPVGQVPREYPWREALWSRLVSVLASVSRQCNHDIAEGVEEAERRGLVGSRRGMAEGGCWI